MKISKSLYIIIAMIFSSACTSPTNYPKDISEILDKVKRNRNELEITIQHYTKDPKDSLKLQAVYFIIKNLDGLTTLDSNTVNNRMYFDHLNGIWQKIHKKLDFSIVSQSIDSLNKIDGLTDFALNANYVADLEMVSSKFLIDNVDNAFLVWRNNPWSKTLSFKGFCEYILPYRCTNTYSYDSRTYFMSRYNKLLDSIGKYNNSFKAGNFIIKDIDSWFTEDPSIFVRYPYLQPITFRDLLKGKIGTCIDVNSLRVTALRSIGIPTTLDEIPNWGNSNSSHFWYRIVDPAHDTTKTLISNTNYPRDTQHLISGSSYDLYPIHPGIPANVQRHFVRTVPKVYREGFSKQSNSLQAVKKQNESIPAYFSNDRLKDVTDEYLECTDVKIDGLNSNIPNQKYAYLCIFDNQKWTPVSWGYVKNNAAEFKNMGRNIVYLPSYYYNGEIVPAGNPFLLTLKGETKEIIPKIQTESVALYTKYPYRIFVEFWQSFMMGGRFQLANNSDLSDSVTVHTIQKLPFYQTDVSVNSLKKFRYLIFQFSGLPQMWVSELEFWGKNEKGKEVKLTGKLIGNPGLYPSTIDQMVDGNRSSYFAMKENSATYVGLDLGEGNAKQITKIRYIPRNDDNAVVPDVDFELFYWKNEWISLGYKKGDENKKVIFKSVPKDALLLLKNVEGGTENRIFTYENQKQLFW